MKKINTILAAINMSVFDNEVIKRAILIAKDTKAQLHFIYAVDISVIDIEISLESFKQEIDENSIKKEMAQKIDNISNTKELEYFIHITVGDEKEQVIHLAQKIRSDLIILGSDSKRSVEEYYFGPTANTIAQKSTLPILLIRNKVDEVYKNILAPTDLSNISKEAILFSKIIFKDSPIKLLYAYENLDDLTMEYSDLDEDDEQAYLGRSHIDIFKQDVGVDKIEILKNCPSINESLTKYIQKNHSDLVLLGSKGPDVLGSYLGSTSAHLLRNIDSDILIYIPKSIVIEKSKI